MWDIRNTYILFPIDFPVKFLEKYITELYFFFIFKTLAYSL